MGEMVDPHMGRQTKGLSQALVRCLSITWLVAIALGTSAANAAEVKIGERHGGDLLTHINQATYMMSTGNGFRVVGDQYSAAAMQVLFIESQYPDRVCASPRVRLHFHLAFDPIAHKNDKEPDWVFTAFIRPENLKRLGSLPEFGHGFKTVRAIDFVGRCASKAIACNVKG